MLLIQGKFAIFCSTTNQYKNEQNLEQHMKFLIVSAGSVPLAGHSLHWQRCSLLPDLLPETPLCISSPFMCLCSALPPRATPGHGLPSTQKGAQRAWRVCGWASELPHSIPTGISRAKGPGKRGWEDRAATGGGRPERELEGPAGGGRLLFSTEQNGASGKWPRSQPWQPMEQAKSGWFDCPIYEHGSLTPEGNSCRRSAPGGDQAAEGPRKTPGHHRGHEPHFRNLCGTSYG